MIKGLVGTGTLVEQLKHGLDASSIRTKSIAHRVANASNDSAATFEQTLQGALQGEADAIDLESEMVRLADEQLRFDATSRLLSRMYGQIRSSLRSQ